MQLNRNTYYSKKWREKNPERHAEHLRRYRRNHPEKIKEIKKRWVQKNKERLLEYYRKRRNRPEYKFSKYKLGARNRGYVFELEFDIFCELIQGSCHYCGEKPKQTNGIDRVDNKLGYIKDNCVSCCSDCNYFKGKNDYNDFVAKIRKIAKHLCKE